MGIQQNLADTIRAVMVRKQKSLDEFSEELQISRSSLQDYLKARGNPTVAMVEHLAQRLEMDPAVLLTGLLSLERQDILLLLLDTLRGVSELPYRERLRFAELFWEMIQLWNTEK